MTLGFRLGGAVVAVALIACGNVKNTVDAAGSIDGPPDPTTTVSVSTAGDDANDGVTKPVKTLKRAIAIATANGAITTITVAAGKYGAANGETYPYTVPGNVTIEGAAAGGSILAGSMAETGLVLDTGKLQDIEFEDFATAISSTGTANLANVHVRTSTLGLSVETSGKLTASALNITGSGCATAGVKLNGGGQLDANGLTSTGLGSHVEAKDQSALTIVTGNLTGDATCPNTPLILATTTKTLSLTDTTITGGSDGLSFSGTVTTATLTNTTIKNVASDALGGRPLALTMTGGELSNNGRGGLEAAGGSWTFTNVGFKNNPVFGIYLQGSSLQAPGVLVMHGCTVTGNGFGIYLFDFAVGDLGTAATPGNNTIQGNTNPGLDIDGNGGPRKIDAVGNTWRAGVQGANAQGKYAAGVTPGPVVSVDGNNFAINNGWSLQF